MARNVIKINLELERIYCHEEGDGWGSAEPYLWVVFFKLDGETVQLTESLTLSGTAVTHDTPGSHGNLGDAEVGVGDEVTIPAALGEWETLLKPIATPVRRANAAVDLGGVVGAVVILMEEDNVTDEGAEAGHQALNAAVRDALQAVIDTRSLTSEDQSEAELDGLGGAIEAKVREAVINQRDIFEELWSWLNPDDTIGTKVFIFDHDELEPGTTRSFSHRWRDEGDWEICGHITSAALCPANALGDLATRELAAAELPSGLADMRAFRDGVYREMPGLARWFALVERHSTRVVRLALTRPELMVSARKMLEWGVLIARDQESTLSVEHVRHAERLLLALAEHRNRRARVDARRALSMLATLEGKTHQQALQLLAGTAPVRRPNIAMKLRARSLALPKLGA
ncbi:hypothetical protein ENSA5_12030 [Enhygromyxa salina]|uniref:Uncharacterized protein n=1 Tax=Enhygromyxa salina TaxID=215803 RepID=A0A2S9YFF3_9BACT|nr:hypothetical protein [Enhygromyxa salina]PRQ03834.1 hypothetical protein ENSA5_12030 [Enhygromyxa salina]